MADDANGGGADAANGEIARHRAAIDALDDAILARLAERAQHAHAIGTIKGTGAAYRPEREAQVLSRMAAANPGPLPDDAVTGVFRQIMSACLALERRLSIGYLGPAGTFSHAAVHKHFGEFVDAVPYASIDEVFRAAESGQVDYAVVPVENSTEGAVGRTLDLIAQTPLAICGEAKLRVQQHLMTREPALAGVSRVYSHAQSLAQCTRWLARNLPQASRVPVASNAEAARLAGAEAGTAAIAGENAAAIHDVPILVRNIEDEPNNTTRFWVLGPHAAGASGHDQTSVVIACPNKPGALVAVLEPFARHGVSMSRVESRPSRVELWEYLFFVDVAGHASDARVAAALADLRAIAPHVKLLGSYPAPILPSAATTPAKPR
jgi:chorismate mutase/prephenate dehydratase